MSAEKKSTAAAEPMRIEYMRLDELQTMLDPTNPKDHDIGALGQAFERFGFVSPIIINEETKMLIAGHGRFEKLWQLHSTQSPVPERLKIDEDGMWMAPVVRGIQLSEEDGSAYTIADNRLVELGGWNEPELASKLVSLAAANPDFNLRGTGYDEEDLDNLVRLVGSETDWYDGGQIEDIPEPEAENSRAFVIAIMYVAFEDEDTFERGVTALTFGERSVQRRDARYAQIDGEIFLSRWEKALLGIDIPEEEDQ